MSGPALPVSILVLASLGAAATTLLGRVFVEQGGLHRSETFERESWRAVGEIERAKAVIGTALDESGENPAIRAALASDPPRIAGTEVFVEPAGPSRCFRLWSRGIIVGSSSRGADSTSLAQCLVCVGTPCSAYHYYIEDDGLGVSGQAKGRIHTNRALELHGAGGVYSGFVSAVAGFDFIDGASEQNTTFLDGSDPAAERRSLLDEVSFGDLQSHATWTAPAGTTAEITLDRTSVTIDLYLEATSVTVPGTRTTRVLTGFTTTGQTKQTKQSRLDVDEWQWVPVTTTRKLWVGRWTTTTSTTPVYRKVKVRKDGIDAETLTPESSDLTVADDVVQPVARTLLSTLRKPSSGVLYFPGPIASLRGDLQGRLTIVTESTATITGSLRYVDGDGQYAFLNGITPTAGDYLPNPAFRRDHALAVIARGDVCYSCVPECGVPDDVEINGALISTHGRVGLSGLRVSEAGIVTVIGDSRRLRSLRRFGSILSAKRPIGTVLRNDGTLKHGFSSGASVYDEALLIEPPPACPMDRTITFLPSVRRAQGSGR